MNDYLNKAFLLLGTNLGNRTEYISKAITSIEKNCGTVTAQSSLYETAAWGYTNQPKFLNKCIKLETILSAENLIKQLLSIELEMGRIRIEKMGPRIIDIDILLFNNDIIHTTHLEIPHPRLTERKFALMPLAEIAALTIHPIYKRTIQELLLLCTDTLDVHKI